MVRQDGEMSGLQLVAEVPYGLVDCQAVPVIDAVFLLCRADLPGEEGEGLPSAFHSLLEGGTYGGG